MLPQQVTLLKTILPRFQGIKTPPDVTLWLLHYSTELTEAEAEQAIGSYLDREAQSDVGLRPQFCTIEEATWLVNERDRYACSDSTVLPPCRIRPEWKRFFPSDSETAARHWWALGEPESTPCERTYYYYHVLAKEAAESLGDWAIQTGIARDTLTIHDSESRWLCALFDLAWKQSLPVKAICNPIRDWRGVTFRLRRDGRPEPEDVEMFNLDTLPVLGFHSIIPDAIRASCYAIEYLAHAVNPSEATPAGWIPSPVFRKTPPAMNPSEATPAAAGDPDEQPQDAATIPETSPVVAGSDRSGQDLDAEHGQDGGGDAKDYPTPDNYERDKWIFDQRRAGWTITEIIEHLENRSGWWPISSENGVREAAKRYADFIGAEVPKGRPGKPRVH